jgi:signal transduction histidine kinase
MPKIAFITEYYKVFCSRVTVAAAAGNVRPDSSLTISTRISDTVTLMRFRVSTALLTGALVTALGLAMVFLAKRSRTHADEKIAEVIQELPVAAILNLDLIDAQLVDANAVYPQFFSYDQTQLRTLKKFAESCDPKLIPRVLPPKLRKAWVYHQYDCGKLAALPEHFFAEAPLMHPTGASFAWLLRHQLQRFDPAVFRSLHMLELAEVAKLGIALPEELRILAGIEQTQLRALNAGGKLLYGKKLVGWVDTESEAGRRLMLFPAAKFNAAMAARRFADPKYENFGLMLAAAGLFSLLTCALLQIRHHIVERRRFDQEKQFLLQALTHELRTPAASLRLTIEGMRSQLEALPEFAQEGVLRIAEDVSRLSRVIKASESLVRMEMAKDQVMVIESLADFLRDIAESEAVEFVGAGDCRLSTNPRWLAIAVRNLLENGKKHGKPPVVLGLEVNGKLSRVFVEDRGELKAASIQQLSAAKTTKNSSGLGFGLQLVERICRTLGGRFSVVPGKARFEMSWET